MKTEINRSSITGKVPAKAQFAKLNPSREFVEMFYRVNECDVPLYYGEQGGWHGSFSFTAADLTPENGFLKITD